MVAADNARKLCSTWLMLCLDSIDVEHTRAANHNVCIQIPKYNAILLRAPLFQLFRVQCIRLKSVENGINYGPTKASKMHDNTIGSE